MCQTRTLAAPEAAATAAEVLRAIEMGVFVPNPGWQCKDCPFKSACCEPDL
jgi:CRISPR/Cas system-associated exonuclease Cas4 (RecB family)